VPPMLACAYNLLQQQDNSPTPFDRLLRRDRTIVAIALLILILLAWFYVGRLAASMEVAGVTGTRMVSTGTRMVTISLVVRAVSDERACRRSG
jgi:predicted metal-binding membrane protein